MFTWDNFDPATSKTAKRSLLAFSIGTLLLANITILSEEFSFSGLVVEVSQSRLIALGQVLSFAFFILFIIKELPNVVTALQLRAVVKLKHAQKAEQSALADFWGFNQGQEYDHSPDGEFKELAAAHEYQHSRTEEKFRAFISSANMLAGFITNYLIPISAGIVAITYPSALDQLTSYLVSK